MYLFIELLMVCIDWKIVLAAISTRTKTAASMKRYSRAV